MPLKKRKQALARTRQVRRARPRAVTLIEVLLVLVVLVLIAATAWPLMQRSFASWRLRDAADLVRAEWAGARAKAMHSGAAQRFLYTPQEQTYWVEPCEDVLGSSDEQSSTAANAPADVESASRHSMLPDKIYFHEGQVQSDGSRTASADQTPKPAEIDPGMIEDGEPDAPIIFYPDGTSSSARLVLRNEYDRGITITIRGLTGMSDVREIFNIEDRL